jgi:tetratricopeptide (TPR) repeat protein
MASAWNLFRANGWQAVKDNMPDLSENTDGDRLRSNECLPTAGSVSSDLSLPTRRVRSLRIIQNGGIEDMPHASITLELAIEAFRARRLQEAETLGRQALESRPDDIEALSLLRQIAQVLHRTDDERRLLTRILELAPDHAVSLHGLASLLRREGHRNEALKPGIKAVEIDPQFALAHNTLGLCYLELGDSARAIGCFQTAVSIQPDFASAYVNMGSAYIRTGRSGEAADCFRQAVKIDPNAPQALQALGHLLMQQRKWREATGVLRQVVSLLPTWQSHLALSEALAQQGASREAEALARQAILLEPKMPAAHTALGYQLLSAGSFELAEDEFKEAIRLKPSNVEAYTGLVSGKRISALDLREMQSMEALSHSPNLSQIDLVGLYACLAKGYDDLGEYEKAIRSADEGSRLASSLGFARLEVSGEGADRFFQETQRAFNPESFNTCSFRQESRVPILILGLPRSGTTLVEQMLSGHSQVAAGGEVSFWEDLRLSTQGGLIALAGREQEAVDAVHLYLQVLQEIGDGRPFVTDKFNDNARNLGFIHMTLPNARVIFCKRNLIDVSLSMYLTVFRRKPPPFYTREGIIEYIRRNERLLKYWRQTLPRENILELAYEELVSDPQTAMRRLLDFCQLEWQDAVLHPEQNLRAVNTPSKWQARQKIYKTSAERWRNYEPWLGAFRDFAGADTPKGSR